MRKAATIILIVKVIVISLRCRLTEIEILLSLLFIVIVVCYCCICYCLFIFCHLSSVEGGQCISSPLDYLQDVHVEEGEGGKGQDVQEHGAEHKDFRDFIFKTFTLKKVSLA